MQKVTVVIITNPFSLDKDIRIVDYAAPLNAVGYVKPFLQEEEELVYSVNGVIVDKPSETYLQPGDYLVVCPVVGKGGGGKNPLQLIAGIALSVVTMGVGGVASGLGWGASMASWTIGGYMAAAAVMYFGGQLLSNVFAPAIPDYDANSTSTPTYGWDNASITLTQGGPVPLTYGTVKIKSPMVLSQHITVDGTNQYYNLLLCGGEGEVDGIEDIRINDNPLTNYDEVIVEKRFGTNDQTCMSNFSDTFSDQSLSYELDENWTTQLVDGNAGGGLEVMFESPNGLYTIDSQGNFTSASVALDVQSRLVGSETWESWGSKPAYVASTDVAGATAYNTATAQTWTITVRWPITASGMYGKEEILLTGSVSGGPVSLSRGSVYDNGQIMFAVNNLPLKLTNKIRTYKIVVKNHTPVEMAGSSNTSVRKSARVDRLPEGQYEVRCRVVSRSADVNSTRASVRVYWVQLTSIIYDDFVRPGKALVGIRALATSQLSGNLSSITWLQTRDTVYVFNPNINAYEEKPATNPAWACYDLIHLCKRVKNIRTGQYEYVSYGAGKEYFMWQRFKDWADYCDDKNLTVNLLIDSAADLWKALQGIEDCGRGKVVMAGTKFSCVCDKPTTPVQMFTMGNIYMDSFKEEFLGLDDRANAVEVAFNNKEKNYERDSFTVYAEGYDTSTSVENPTQITLNGITTYEDAYREAHYRLLLNKYLIRTCTFDADVDSIACQVGDVILLSHDVPQWGFSGRVKSATSNTVTLERTVDITAGLSYGIYVRLANDTIVYKSVVVSATTSTATVTVSTPFSSIPAAGDIFTFGEMSKEAKPFRVVSINRSNDFRRRITCLEYNEAVYNELDVIPTKNYSALPKPIFDVTNINLTQDTYRQKDGTNISVIYVSWKVPRGRVADSFRVYYSSNNGASWVYYGETKQDTIGISRVRALNTYKVKIITRNLMGQYSRGVVSRGIYVSGKDTPPDNVTGLKVSVDSANLTRAIVYWDKVDDIDLAGYRVSVNGAVVFPLVQHTQVTYTKADNNGTYTFSVVAVDRAGNVSLVPAKASCGLKVYPSAVTGFNVIQNGEEVLFVWHKNPETDVIGYEIRQGGTFNAGALIATGITDTTFSVLVSSETTYVYTIKAINYAGNYSEDEAIDDVTITGLLPKNVLVTYDEIALKTGAKEQVQFTTSNMTFQSLPGRFMDYPTRTFIEFGTSQVLTLAKNGGVYYPSGTYTAVRKDLGGVTTSNTRLYFTSPNIILNSGLTAAVEFRTSLDGGTFTAWKTFKPAKMTYRYIDLRVKLATKDTSIAPEVGNLVLTIDVDDVEKTGIATIPASGATVSFGYKFNAKPVFLPTAEGDDLDVNVSSVTTTGATVKVVNAVTRASVGGTLHWRAKGY